MTGEPRDDDARTGTCPVDRKKTDTLQLRIDPDTKAEFIEACEQNGTSASQVLRKSILDYLALYRRRFETRSKGLIAMVPTPVRKKRYILAAAAASIGVGVLALAPSAAAQTDFATLFHQMDRDGDGFLSGEEFRTREDEWTTKQRSIKSNETFVPHPGEFVRMMVDQNGVRREMSQDNGETKVVSYATKLTGAELEKKLRSLRSIAVTLYDTDGDRKISVEEFDMHHRKEAMELFQRNDIDVDGYLDRSEVKAGTRYEAGPPVANSPDEIFREIPVSAAERFDRMDADNNGRVTRDEFIAVWAAYYSLVYLVP